MEIVRNGTGSGALFAVALKCTSPENQTGKEMLQLQPVDVLETAYARSRCLPGRSALNGSLTLRAVCPDGEESCGDTTRLLRPHGMTSSPIEDEPQPVHRNPVPLFPLPI